MPGIAAWRASKDYTDLLTPVKLQVSGLGARTPATLARVAHSAAMSSGRNWIGRFPSVPARAEGVSHPSDGFPLAWN